MKVYKILEENKFSILREEDNILLFQCERNHKSSLTKNYILDRYNELQKENISTQNLCTTCKYLNNYLPIFKELEKKYGFNNFEYIDANNISYTCNCGNRVLTTSISNLKNSKGHCKACEKKSRVVSLENVLSRFKKTVLFLEGYRVDTEKEIKNNKSIPMICPVGHSYLGHLSNMEKGQSKCQICRKLKKK